MAKMKNENDELLFNHGNIVIFFFSTKFLKLCSEYMANTNIYHIAKKEIQTFINDNEEKVQGIKLELFNFDICKLAKNYLILETDRESEFSPLKNFDGNDSPYTCRNDYSNLNLKRLSKVNAIFKGFGICEISPLLSYDGEGLDSFQNKTIELPCYLIKK
jgi:UDP-N-acetylglucosamine/UDP-N-acetylgalactosamine diphosphorylase